MNILNRREIFLTWDFNEMTRVRERLDLDNIKCKIKTSAHEYRIYVHKNDYERAKYILR